MCPASDNRLQLIGVHKLTTSDFFLSENGDVNRVNNTVAKILAMACNEDQNNSDAHLPHVDYAYNNPAQASLPIKYTSDAYRTPPIAVFDRSYRGARQSPDRTTQPRTASPALKVNVTSREPTESSLTMFIVSVFYPLPYLLKPPIWYHSVDGSLTTW